MGTNGNASGFGDPFRKDKFDAYIAISTLKAKIRQDRIDREWKIYIGLWGGMAAFSYFTYKTPVPMWFVIILSIIVFLIILFMSKINYDTSERDAKIMYYYLDLAEAEASGIRVVGVQRSPYRPRRFEFLMKTHGSGNVYVNSQTIIPIVVTLTMAFLMVVSSTVSDSGVVSGDCRGGLQIRVLNK